MELPWTPFVQSSKLRKFLSDLYSRFGQYDDLPIVDRPSTWSRKPNSYPSFAEYSEAPSEQDGIQDTGLTLSAFLPYSTPLDRQSIQSYSGPTTVLDAHVSCQRPIFEKPTVEADFNGLSLLFEGLVSASTHTPRLGNITLQDEALVEI